MSGVNGIAAVVLNYKTWQDAVNCVRDLLAQDHPDKHIVIVDNGSGNESADKLAEAFGGDKNVTLLVSGENLGFARGNNLGIRYAHEVLGYDTVFVVNSDTLSEQGLFSAIAGLDTDGVGAVSPTVVTPDGEPQYFPVNCRNITSQAYSTVWNLIKANVVTWPVVRDIYKRVKKKTGEKLPDPNAPAEAYVLQGSAYFLTPDFFRHYRGIYPRTFLFWEEVDLLLMLKRAGLASVYAETPKVTHFGGGSTQEIERRVSSFRLKQSNRSMIKSLPLILGMSEKRIGKVIDRSEQFSVPAESLPVRKT